MSIFMLGWGCWLAFGGGHCRQTYLLFPEVLVERFADRHRIIAWSDIKPPKPVGPIKEYDFPVRDDRPVRFDFTMPDHAALAQAITPQRLLWILGGEAALRALAVGTPAPYFLVSTLRLVSPWTYRVSVLGQHLLLLNLGTHRADAPQADAPGYVMQVFSHELFETNLRQAAGADERRLFDLAVEIDSILLSGKGLQQVRLLSPAAGGAGRLILTHATEGEMTFEFTSAADAVTAVRELGRLSVPLTHG